MLLLVTWLACSGAPESTEAPVIREGRPVCTWVRLRSTGPSGVETAEWLVVGTDERAATIRSR